MDAVKIIKAVCLVTGYTWKEFKSKRKTDDIAIPRMLCAYLLCTLTDLGLVDVGLLINRHHTSIMYARNEIQARLASEQWPRITEMNQKVLVELEPAYIDGIIKELNICTRSIISLSLSPQKSQALSHIKDTIHALNKRKIDLREAMNKKDGVTPVNFDN